MRRLIPVLGLILTSPLLAQAPGKFPPDSLLNLRVIPQGTPIMNVIGIMRNFAGALGVRCQFCHVGQEGMPLAQFDFASDDKRTKQVARQMMRMVEEINRRLDTIPGRPSQTVSVTCATCHRGINRPIPLAQQMAEVTVAFGADSATRNYQALRERYFGRDAYDFSEFSLNSAALRVARQQRYDEAMALLALNEEHFPNASSISLFRGNIQLIRGDTAAGAREFREAIRRDSTNSEARSRLRDIGQRP